MSAVIQSIGSQRGSRLHFTVCGPWSNLLELERRDVTEEQWLTSTDPTEMLAFLRNSGRASERKLRLFAVACCRHIWPLMSDDRFRAAVVVAEQYADGGIIADKMFEAASSALEAPNVASFFIKGKMNRLWMTFRVGGASLAAARESAWEA